MTDSQISRPKHQGNKTNTGQLSAWYYLSFGCDITGEFLGAAIVDAGDIEAAATRAWELEINPGGEVRGCNVPMQIVPKACFRDRLLTREEVNIAFPLGTYSVRERRAEYPIN